MKPVPVTNNRLTSKVPVKYSIALVLIVLLLIVVSVVGWFFALQERAAIMQGREQLTNSVAIQTSVLLNKHQYATLEKSLSSIVACNDDLQSAALRSTEGEIKASVGDHDRHWIADQAERIAETQIATPLRLGSGTWGHLEFRFRPIHAERPFAWFDPKYAFLSLLMLVTAILVPYYLGILLRQFDLSKAVPRQIEGAFDTLTEGLMLTDQNGKIRSANKTFSNWIGVPSELLKGNKPDSVGCALSETGVGKPASGLAPWEEASLSGQPVTGASMRLHDPKTGLELSLIANSTPINGANGAHIGVLTSFQDVTALEKQNAEFCKAKESADTAIGTRNKLLSRMSHEIRTSMNAILGYSEVIGGERESDPELQQQLQTIRQRGESLIALSDDMLELSNLEADKILLENSTASIFQVISDVMSKQSAHARKKGIYLKSQIPEKLPATIETDADRLRQSLTNLVSNAIKYTQTGGVTLETTLVQQPGTTTPMLSFKVTDTGEGMTPEAQTVVFKPFSEADDSTACSISGTDFKYAICKELANKMGGGLAFESQSGVGSVFQQVVSIGDISDVERVSIGPIERPTSNKGKAGQVVDLPPMNILIVDDGETNRQILSVYFKKENVTFDQAPNGQVAVEMVNAGQFDVVLMDMQMPIMNGFEATKLLRSQGHELPIIALTANAMEQDKRACFKAGCSSFLAKPTERERLFTELSLAVTGDIVWRDKVLPAPKTDSKEIQSQETAASDSLNGFIGSTLPMDDADFIEVAEIFTEGLYKKVDLMITALEDGDFEQLSSLGHWLKGAAGSAGYEPLTPPGRALEQVSKDQDLNGCIETVQEISELTARVRVLPELPSA